MVGVVGNQEDSGDLGACPPSAATALAPASQVEPQEGLEQSRSSTGAEDLAERLRNARMMVNYGHGNVGDEPDPLHEEAADEIERLHSLAKANNQLARINGDHRDEWRAKAVACAEALEHILAGALSLPRFAEEAARAALAKARGEDFLPASPTASTSEGEG